MPHLRFRLPSRNWLIFLTVTGSWFAAVFYDRREKRRVQHKWASLVAHVAREPLPPNELRRRLTVVLAAPPGDGLRSARDFFKEYVKPILVAGALDYE
ncbi:mitochondrial import inner membrane translocase subunit tim54, partial [Ascosphaera acerosa]